jgi:hypothetical protein
MLDQSNVQVLADFRRKGIDAIAEAAAAHHRSTRMSPTKARELVLGNLDPPYRIDRFEDGRGARDGVLLLRCQLEAGREVVFLNFS